MERSTRTVTALKAQQKNPQRINVYLDGEFAFGLSRIVAAWLRVGQSLTDERVAELLQEDQVENLYQRALHYLSFRLRSEQEMNQYLLSHEKDEQVRMRVLERLKSNGWLDDQQFAAQWVENRTSFRPRGKKALLLELRQRGVKTDVIEQALEAIDETELAYQAAQKVVSRYRGLDKKTFQRKLYETLMRRGFSYEVVQPTVHRCWQEYHQNPEMEQEER
ncbi:MAG: RecX family transcriptional regulator [Anaerolineales bacterium]|nr:RecX family transcriptional regulator [Anaerolineales bacterium]